jgi:hypothetical protein
VAGSHRFRIDQSIYDLDQDGNPYPKLRLPQLTKTGNDGEPIGRTFERFDLIGALLDEKGVPGQTLYVECKEYSQAGDQGKLYDEYLAVCYSGFVKQSRELQAPADVEFMWATTHPFAQGNFVNLTTADQIRSACETRGLVRLKRAGLALATASSCLRLRARSRRDGPKFRCPAVSARER